MAYLTWQEFKRQVDEYLKLRGLPETTEIQGIDLIYPETEWTYPVIAVNGYGDLDIDMEWKGD